MASEGLNCLDKADELAQRKPLKQLISDERQLWELQRIWMFLKPRIRCTYGLRLYYVDKPITGSYIRIMGEINRQK